MDIGWALIPAVILLIKTGVDLTKFLQAKDWSNVATILYVWAVGIVVTFLLRASDFDITVGNYNLNDLNVFSTILVGVTLAGSAVFANETLKALDRHETTEKPDLFKKEKEVEV